MGIGDGADGVMDGPIEGAGGGGTNKRPAKSDGRAGRVHTNNVVILRARAAATAAATEARTNKTHTH